MDAHEQNMREINEALDALEELVNKTFFEVTQIDGTVTTIEADDFYYLSTAAHTVIFRKDNKSVAYFSNIDRVIKL